MKVIELLNKIANGEEPPKEIYYKKQWWEYNPDNDYEGTGWGGCFLNNVLINELNDEIEIIEEEKDIEEINKSYPIFNFDEKSFIAMKEMLQDVYEKQSEIIKAVNELKNKGD